MAVNCKTYTWISLWFLITTPILFWDAGFCFFRPRSMKGGDLHWLWKPYALYQEVDHLYSVEAYENNVGFTNAQAFMNVVENCFNLAYLWLAHISDSSAAPLIGFAGVCMTFSKTVLYWLQEYYCGGCSVWHNDWETLIPTWILPNLLWTIFPAIIAMRLGGDIAVKLYNEDRKETKRTSGKTL